MEWQTYYGPCATHCLRERGWKDCEPAYSSLQPSSVEQGCVLGGGANGWNLRGAFGRGNLAETIATESHGHAYMGCIYTVHPEICVVHGSVRYTGRAGAVVHPRGAAEIRECS